MIEHDYFKELDFGILLNKQYKSPWKPTISNPLDRSNFEEYDADESVQRYRGPADAFRVFT